MIRKMRLYRKAKKTKKFNLGLRDFLKVGSGTGVAFVLMLLPYLAEYIAPWIAGMGPLGAIVSAVIIGAAWLAKRFTTDYTERDDD